MKRSIQYLSVVFFVATLVTGAAHAGYGDDGDADHPNGWDGYPGIHANNRDRPHGGPGGKGYTAQTPTENSGDGGAGGHGADSNLDEDFAVAGWGGAGGRSGESGNVVDESGGGRRRLDPTQVEQRRLERQQALERQRQEVRQQREKRRQEMRTQEPALDWKGSGLLAMLHEAFRLMGYEEDAIHYAQIAYDSLDPIDEPGGELDWRNSNPFIVFREAFMAVGIERADAAALSFAVLGEMGLDPTTVETTPEATGLDVCEVYPVKILYCDGDQRKLRFTYINSQVWDSVLACPKPIGYVCPGTDWYTMHSSGDCGGDFLPADTCFWITATGPKEWIECSLFIIQRSCVTELDPSTDCQNIELKCGPETGSPDGCPCE